MSITRIETRARTRGKSPQEFTFQGVGLPKSRRVNDKDGLAIVVDAEGKQVKYAFDDKGNLIPSDSGITVDAEGHLVLAEGQRFVEVDDLDVVGLASQDGALQSVIDLFGSVTSEVPALVRLLTGALEHFNILARQDASPVKEVEVDDELAPIVNTLISAGILTDETSSVWRRSVSTSAKLMEMPRLTISAMTKEYKAAIAKGVKFPEAVGE